MNWFIQYGSAHFCTYDDLREKLLGRLRKDKTPEATLKELWDMK